jgi:hypothetical protein
MWVDAKAAGPQDQNGLTTCASYQNWPLTERPFVIAGEGFVLSESGKTKTSVKIKLKLTATEARKVMDDWQFLSAEAAKRG